MNALRGNLIVQLYISLDGRREKRVQLRSWPYVTHDECEGLLAEFFANNMSLDRRQCFAHWTVNEQIQIPRN